MVEVANFEKKKENEQSKKSNHNFYLSDNYMDFYVLFIYYISKY